MSMFTDVYVEKGLSQVVQLSADSKEETSGFQEETETETVVARTNLGGHIWLSSKLVKKYGPNGGRKLTESRRDISEDEYATLAAKGVLLDLSRALGDREADQAKKEAKNNLLASAPRCSTHDRKMTLKEGKFGAFWSCPKYPACKSTANLTAAQQKLLQASQLR